MVKQSMTFSVDMELASKFLEEVGDDKNRVIEKLMRDHIRDQTRAYQETIDIKCPKCGASFSSKLGSCPACKMSQADQGKIDEIDSIKKRIELHKERISKYSENPDPAAILVVQNSQKILGDLEAELKLKGGLA